MANSDQSGAAASNETAPPIADLHCHYPMHVLAGEHGYPPRVALDQLVKIRRRQGFVETLRAAAVALAARIRNHRQFFDKWRVDLEGLHETGVRIVFSVLYSPFAELDLEKLGSADPEEVFFERLIEQIRVVEKDLKTYDPDRKLHLPVAGTKDLEAAIAGPQVGIIHAVEGGFHLGRDPNEIPQRVATLASKGVAYVTLAHLFWRGVATNTPALPFLPDWLYNRAFPQPPGDGLSPLGRVIVRAMYEHGVLVDISHMRQDAIDETFALLKDLDKEFKREPEQFPVIATHSGYRFRDQAYMLDGDTIQEVQRRDGVIGLIMARHQLNDGLDVKDEDAFECTLKTVREHIEAIARETGGSYDHVGLGTDLDGFIKPTLGGIESVRDLGGLRTRLLKDYPDDAEKILSGNAVRVLKKAYAIREAGGGGGSDR